MVHVHRTFVDHVIAWAIALPIGVYGLTSLAIYVAVLTRAPGTPRGGVTELFPLMGIAAVYGAVATLQNE